uniref:DUF4806 domain-containing protein n=1 Tax=Strongyloides venezuelensis TaxID=75913 RepID=A0A0K0FB72_STRVS
MFGRKRDNKNNRNAEELNNSYGSDIRSLRPNKKYTNDDIISGDEYDKKTKRIAERSLKNVNKFHEDFRNSRDNMEDELSTFMNSTNTKNIQTASNEGRSNSNLLTSINVLKKKNPVIKINDIPPTDMPIESEVYETSRTKDITNEQILVTVNDIKEKVEEITKKLEDLDTIYRKVSNLGEIQFETLFNAIADTSKNIKENSSTSNVRLIRRRNDNKCCYHLKDDSRTAFADASNDHLLETIYEMREREYGKEGLKEIKNPQLKEFLRNSKIESNAFGHLKDTGKFCKYVVDQMVPQEALLKYFLPSTRSKREKKYLFNDIIVKTIIIALQYLGSSIIEKEDQFLSYGIHLVNIRSTDKKNKNANVTFYTHEEIDTFFKMEHIRP